MFDPSIIISAGVGPIIVISACGLLCLAFYNRLAGLVTRLRAFHRERMHEQDQLARLARSGVPADDSEVVRYNEIIGMLDVQTRHVRRRAQLIQRTLLLLLFTIACLAVCSLCVGLGAVWPALLRVAVALFIIGLLLLVAGVSFAIAEMKMALDPVDLESRFVRSFAEEFAAG